MRPSQDETPSGENIQGGWEEAGTSGDGRSRGGWEGKILLAQVRTESSRSHILTALWTTLIFLFDVRSRSTCADSGLIAGQCQAGSVSWTPRLASLPGKQAYC
ncbi:hypothetical protein ASPZODRAFT_127695 [Penicilliopsis zonata CBS 506.65]|uniref:Uncharacterized protein n=1 Tax=Penicilliopsis zonata CBS 506.65 TaxID=1073090 RepID=A0A1L9SWU3_9EURO|nr:hypothetical protein ASPZODRAFT_127695 [Penicilliopsis zonata CBS 506.65]OJJ51597.1 hypothetical protein ASPZODRAFT_127695 [Penicilliopsis zonata CBS 506.65]